jgi:hypothetical protein
LPQNPTENSDSLAAVELIHEKRLLLKRVVMITRATERMQDSLKSVLILGQPSTSIPEGMLKYYHILSNKVKQKPTEKVRWYLKKLEELIKSNLQGIIKLTLQEQDAPDTGQSSEQEADDYSDEAMTLLSEFKRQSQTAVALKILLQQRGIYTSGTVIKASVQQIEGHIKRLEKREEIQRKKLQAHIAEMHVDLNVMLKSDKYSDDMKRVFRKVIVDLESDKQAIERGGRINDLQLSFEMVETGVERNNSPEEVQQKVVDETEEYLEEIDQNGTTDKESDKRGFFRTLLKWLNTPWKVSWSDVRKGRR